MKGLFTSGMTMGLAALLSSGAAIADLSVAFVGPITGQVAAVGEQGTRGA